MSKKSIYAVKNDEEGRSPVLREKISALAEGKSLSSLKINREISGERRFTSERLRELLTALGASDVDKNAVWKAYFNNKPVDSVFELVRQSINRRMSFHDFVKITGVDHETLGNILTGKAPTYCKFRLLLPHLDGDCAVAKRLWRIARGRWYMEERGQAALGTHLDLLLEMNDTSLRQWVDIGEMPSGLGGISKNGLKLLFRDARAGTPVPWDEVVRLLNVLLHFPKDSENADEKERKESAAERTSTLEHMRAIMLSWLCDLRKHDGGSALLQSTDAMTCPMPSGLGKEEAGMRTIFHVGLDMPEIQYATPMALMTGDFKPEEALPPPHVEPAEQIAPAAKEVEHAEEVLPLALVDPVEQTPSIEIEVEQKKNATVAVEPDEPAYEGDIEVERSELIAEQDERAECEIHAQHMEDAAVIAVSDETATDTVETMSLEEAFYAHPSAANIHFADNSQDVLEQIFKELSEDPDRIELETLLDDAGEYLFTTTTDEDLFRTIISGLLPD